MIVLSSLVVAVLFACGIYLMLSRSTQWIAIGFILLSNGVNLFVLTAAGLPQGPVPPLLSGAEDGAAFADPLPQAFILTAIVIGLGTSSFLLALAARAHRERGTDQLRGSPRGDHYPEGPQGRGATGGDALSGDGSIRSPAGGDGTGEPR